MLDYKEIISSCADAKMNIILHYLRGLHFEYNDKESLFTKIEQKKLSGKPEVKAQVNLAGRHLRDDIHESIMDLKVTVSVENEEVYAMYCSYAAVVKIENSDSYTDQQKQYLTTARAGFLLFPFPRHCVFETTSKAGGTPIALDMIDFDNLYIESQKNQDQNDKNKSK